MSSDNGVFVLQTRGPEFRIAYAHAIDNIYGKFNDTTGHWMGNMDSMIDYFGSSKVYTNLDDAWSDAEGLAYDYEDLEHGLCLISDFKDLKFGEVYTK
jgi:hypothetical protein